MGERPESPAKDKNYNLVTVLQQSLENVWRVDGYVQDAEAQGDEELAQWLRKIRDNNQKAGEQGRRMLARRLGENG